MFQGRLWIHHFHWKPTLSSASSSLKDFFRFWHLQKVFGRLVSNCLRPKSGERICDICGSDRVCTANANDCSTRSPDKPTLTRPIVGNTRILCVRVAILYLNKCGYRASLLRAHPGAATKVFCALYTKATCNVLCIMLNRLTSDALTPFVKLEAASPTCSPFNYNRPEFNMKAAH